MGGRSCFITIGAFGDTLMYGLNHDIYDLINEIYSLIYNI